MNKPSIMLANASKIASMIASEIDKNFLISRVLA